MCMREFTQMYIYEGVKLIKTNPPLRGGFLFTMFPDQEPGGRGPPSKNLSQVLEGGPLPPGS